MRSQDTAGSVTAGPAAGQTAGRRLLIDGKLVEAESTYPSLNPATGEVLGHAPEADVTHAAAAVEAARRAFDAGGSARLDGGEAKLGPPHGPGAGPPTSHCGSAAWINCTRHWSNTATSSPRSPSPRSAPPRH